jgi:hypothetical protein
VASASYPRRIPRTRAIGQPHVEGVRSARVNDEVKLRTGIDGLPLLHRFAIRGRCHSVGSTDQHQQRRVEAAIDVALATGIERDAGDNGAGCFSVVRSAASTVRPPFDMPITAIRLASA